MVTRERPRYLLAGWAIVETMLFGGIINGWASLVFVLKEDGLYSYLCVPDPASLNATADNVSITTMLSTTEGAELTCKAQDSKLNLWFTIAAALRNIYGIVIGFHIFRFGTRSARLTGWILFGIGAMMMAFADKSNPWLVLPALISLSYGGVTLLLTNVQISCLFPRASGVVVTLVSGALDFSAATQLLVKILDDSGMVSRLYSYIGMAGLHFVMVLISTLCFLPKDMLLTERDHNTSHFPPQPSDFRKRRDSLYDWSEINVHTNHHGLKCSSCEDSSSDGEQRELAMNHAAGFETSVQDGLPKQLNENQCNCEDTHCPSQIYDSDLSRNQPTTSHSKTPLSHSQAGIHDLNNALSIFTISETLQKAGPSIHMTNFGGKFISIIDVNGRPQSTNNNLEECKPWPQEDEANAETVVNTTECEAVRKDSMKAQTNGCLKVTLDLDTKEHWSTGGSGRTESYVHREGEDTERKDGGEVRNAEKLFPTLKSCLKSVVFWYHVLWFAIHVLRLLAFFGFINSKLTAMFHGDKDKVSFYTNVQAYFTLGIMGVCWISGALYDWQTSVLKERKKAFQREVLPGALPLALTSLLGVAISTAWMIDSEIALYIMFALLVFYNAFIFGICISFILRVFPERYFGILNGVASIVAGAFSFLQYAIFVWHESYADAPFHAEIFMLTLVVLSFIHPTFIVFKSII